MRAFGLKHTRARAGRRERRAAAAGHRPARRRRRRALRGRERIGYPVMLKSTAGGGGIGMRLCRRRGRAAPTPSTPSQRLASANFGDARRVPREVRRAAPATSRCRSSATAPGDVRRARRARLLAAAPQPEGDRGDARARPRRDACASAARRRGARWARAVSYRSAGTVEFVYDADARATSTSSKSTRACRSSTASPRRSPASTWSSGWCGWRRASCRRSTRCAPAADGRVDPGAPLRRGSGARTSSPSAGLLTEVALPAGRARRDLGRARHRGHAVLRSDARQDHRARRGPRRRRSRRLRRALARRRIAGIETNLDYLRAGDRRRRRSQRAASRPRTCASFAYRRRAIEVLDAGHADHGAGLSRAGSATGTSACRRRGRWTTLSFRLANRLVGNADGAAGARDAR